MSDRESTPATISRRQERGDGTVGADARSCPCEAINASFSQRSASNPAARGNNAKISSELSTSQEWPDGNAASVEIRKQRGFPQLLGKVSPKSGETFPHSHRPYWELFSFCNREETD